jgi:hypothetical protein
MQGDRRWAQVLFAEECTEEIDQSLARIEEAMKALQVN